MNDEKFQKSHLRIFVLHIGIVALIQFTTVILRTSAECIAVTSLSKLFNGTPLLVWVGSFNARERRSKTLFPSAGELNICRSVEHCVVPTVPCDYFEK
jgi:hypothetical protein